MSETTPDLEKQIAILKQQLAQAQKMTALGELVSTTTHEFNNVLMTIINYAKLGLRLQRRRITRKGIRENSCSRSAGEQNHQFGARRCP